NLGDYFDKLAKYSNGNFFSKDTILSSEYPNPSVNSWQYRKNIHNEEELLGLTKDSAGSYVIVKKIVRTNELTINDKDILDGYWDRLSKEVVLNGAGVLKLFIDEAEAAKTEYVNRPPEKPSWFARLFGLIGVGVKELTTSDGVATSDVKNQGVDNSNDGDSIVTLDSTSSPLPLVATSKVTNPSVSPTPLVTKTPNTNVTTPTPSVSPSKTPTPTPKPSATPTPSPTPKLSTTKTSGSVVINEIAWAGTQAAATDEWLELYNTENNPIDISSWQLVSNDNSPDIIFSEGTIMQAKSYFLIERTDDNTVSDIMADLAVSFGQGGLNNTGEMVRLFDSAGIVVDVVGSAGETWYFGDSSLKNSMERIDPMKAGNNASNWKSFSGVPVNKDALNNPINGTPKTKNSMAVQVVVSTSGGGGGGGGSSSTPTPTPTVTPTPSPTPTPTPTPSPSPTPSPTSEPDGDSANLGDIVINEIAWMGTSIENGRYCEWIELRNTTSGEINLAGWGIHKNGGDALIMSLTGKISPNGYYLIERVTNSCPDPVPGANDDAGTFGGGDLANTGESLVLKDVSGTIINQVDGSNGWKINGNDVIIGNNDTKETAQKMAGGWITATSTPKAQNSANVVQNPSAVTNLVATLNSPLTITWSAPNPGSFNTASLSYDLRYSAVNFPDANTW
ncbi:MAG: lamin tail domain-containing protein, partial [Patescibacteria group bacterium]